MSVNKVSKSDGLSRFAGLNYVNFDVPSVKNIGAINTIVLDFSNFFSSQPHR